MIELHVAVACWLLAFLGGFAASLLGGKQELAQARRDNRRYLNICADLGSKIEGLQKANFMLREMLKREAGR